MGVIINGRSYYYNGGTMKKEAIEKIYNEIMEKFQGASLFGEPIDMSNEKELVVAAYLMGQGEELKQKIEMMEMFRILDSARKIQGWFLRELEE